MVAPQIFRTPGKSSRGQTTVHAHLLGRRVSGRHEQTGLAHHSGKTQQAQACAHLPEHLAAGEQAGREMFKRVHAAWARERLMAAALLERDEG